MTGAAVAYAISINVVRRCDIRPSGAQNLTHSHTNTPKPQTRGRSSSSDWCWLYFIHGLADKKIALFVTSQQKRFRTNSRTWTQPPTERTTFDRPDPKNWWRAIKMESWNVCAYVRFACDCNRFFSHHGELHKSWRRRRRQLWRRRSASRQLAVCELLTKDYYYVNVNRTLKTRVRQTIERKHLRLWEYQFYALGWVVEKRRWTRACVWFSAYKIRPGRREIGKTEPLFETDGEP